LEEKGGRKEDCLNRRKQHQGPEFVGAGKGEATSCGLQGEKGKKDIPEKCVSFSGKTRRTTATMDRKKKGRTLFLRREKGRMSTRARRRGKGKIIHCLDIQEGGRKKRGEVPLRRKRKKKLSWSFRLRGRKGAQKKSRGGEKEKKKRKSGEEGREKALANHRRRKIKPPFREREKKARTRERPIGGKKKRGGKRQKKKNEKDRLHRKGFLLWHEREKRNCLLNN